MSEDYNIVCKIPNDVENFTEIKKMTEKEKTISFLIGFNSVMSIRKNGIYKKDDTDEILKGHYENIIRGKEIEMNITKTLYNEERERIRIETREENELLYNEILKKNEELKEQMHVLEKELVLKNENIRHTKELNKTMVELEIRDTLKEKDDRIIELEKQIIINNYNKIME
jgi:hypothetical protein